MAMAPGWYQDPFSSAGYVRWWDGERWGASTSLPDGVAPTAPGVPVPLPPPGSAPAIARPASTSYAVPAPGAPAYGAPAFGTQLAPPLASWGRRAVARILDTLIESLVLGPYIWALLGPAYTRFADAVPAYGRIDQAVMQQFIDDVTAVSLQLSVAVLLVTFVYEVPQNRLWGRTLGKRALGIRIRPLAADGQLSWGQTILRWATYEVGAAVLGGIWTLIDYLWPLWDKPWRQALHDKTARTIVVPTVTRSS